MRTALGLWLLLAACSSAPVLAPDAEPVLAEGEAMVTAGQFEPARELLESRAANTFPKRVRDRYTLALGHALRGVGENYEAFKAIRGFADDFPHSELRQQIIELEFALGRDLLRSTAGFWIFWSDRDGGRNCLEHLITRYPENSFMTDALRLLGDAAFADQDYTLAQERYRDLLRRNPESEWAAYARYRYAMSIVATLRGADYDLDEMQHACKELADLLANPPENPEFVADAKAALSRILDWRAERHWNEARFYRRIDNQPGYLQQLQRAADPEFADTDHGKLAQRELAEATAANGSRP